MTKEIKIILTAAIVLAAGVVIAVQIAVKHYSKPDLAKTSTRQISENVDPNQSRDANENKRPETRGQPGEAPRIRMETQANEYAALSDAQKTAYLDKIIDQMEARRAEFAPRDANRPDANRPPEPNMFRRFGPQDPNSMRQPQARQFRQPAPPRTMEVPEGINTDARVKISQFRRDLMNRMQERGIQTPMMRGPGSRTGLGNPGGPGGQGGPGNPGGTERPPQ